MTRILSREQVETAAVRLNQADRTRTQIRPLSLDHPGMTIDDAYAVQRAWINIKLHEGAS